IGADGHRRASGRCGAVLGAVDNLHGMRLPVPVCGSRGPFPHAPQTGTRHDTLDHPLPASTHNATKRSVPVASYTANSAPLWSSSAHGPSPAAPTDTL